MRRLLLIPALVGLWGTPVAALSGCASDSQGGTTTDFPAPPRPPQDISDVEEGEWPFWPQRMRIHPLTQFVTDRKTGEQLIEVRAEFLDPFNHTCKAVGQIVIELHSVDDPAHLSQRIESWPIDLASMTANRDHYDDVTRTYLFRLKVDPDKIPQQPELRAFFWFGDERLQSTYRLPR